MCMCTRTCDWSARPCSQTARPCPRTAPGAPCFVVGVVNIEVGRGGCWPGGWDAFVELMHAYTHASPPTPPPPNIITRTAPTTAAPSAQTPASAPPALVGPRRRCRCLPCFGLLAHVGVRMTGCFLLACVGSRVDGWPRPGGPSDACLSVEGDGKNAAVVSVRNWFGLRGGRCIIESIIQSHGV